jgi:gliding motility-associated-like protein
VFGSDEYNEFVCSSFNDVFGFFLSGPGISGPYSNNAINIAIVPNTTLPVAINTVNIGQPGSAGSAGGCPVGGLNNSLYFVNNPEGSLSIQFDGFTTVLTAKSAVQCSQTYHIKIAIADVFDGAFDSGVFLEANSFTSDYVEIDIANLLADSSIIENCSQANITLSRGNASEELTIFYEVSGNAIPGVDFITLPGFITFPQGENTATFQVIALDDGIFEPGRDTVIIRIFNITSCGDTIVSEGLIFIKEDYLIDVVTNDFVLTCATENIQVTAIASGGLEPYTYVWNTEPPQFTQTAILTALSDTFFIVTVKDACGIVEGIDTVNITYTGPPPLLVVASNDVILEGCPGQIVSLNSLVFDGTPPYSYLWSTGDITQNTSVVVNSDTTIYINVTDLCGFPTAIDSVQISLNYVYPQAAIIDTSVNCSGDELNLNILYIGGTAPIQFIWPTLGITDTIVSVTDACSVSSTGSYQIELPVFPPIIIELNPDTLTICKGTEIVLQASVEGGNLPLTYNWKFPNGDLIIADTIASFVLQQGGNYVFSATDACQVIGKDTTQIDAQNCQVIVATVVSKDGDGFNSNWKISNIELYPNNIVLIYNRWGNLVYEASPYKNEFDFNKNTSGTYFYVLDLKDGTKPFKGTITVLSN